MVPHDGLVAPVADLDLTRYHLITPVIASEFVTRLLRWMYLNIAFAVFERQAREAAIETTGRRADQRDGGDRVGEIELDESHGSPA